MGGNSSQLHVVVIAGGAGTRFWPLSRRDRPKQLLALTGERTLLAATFERVASLAAAQARWMVVGRSHAEASIAAVPDVPADHVLVEPRGRNTAPAIALAAAHVAFRDPDGVIAVLPADHYVADAPALCAALDRAATVASTGDSPPIVTLGIEPGWPETGYGYIERGQQRGADVFSVARFTEKPDAARARAFLERGGFYWNSGMFVMKAAVFMDELRRQLPEHHRLFTGLAESIGRPDYEAKLEAVFNEVEPISIDYGVMEGAADVAVVPVDCGWSDVGSFTAMGELLGADAAGNRTQGRTLPVDSRDCVIVSAGDDDHVVAVLGGEGLVVVHTPGATLVVPASRAQDVRQVVDELAERGWVDQL